MRGKAGGRMRQAAADANRPQMESFDDFLVIDM
jgi:hypothetical protein